MPFFQKHAKHIKNHLVTSEPPFTVRQDLGSCSMLPSGLMFTKSVTVLSLCQKRELFFVTYVEWKSVDSIAETCYYLNKC